GAADAVGFDDYRYLRRLVLATVAVVGQGGNTENMGKCTRAGIASGRAVIDARTTGRHRLGIRAAAVIAALPALGLWQHPVQAFDQRSCSLSVRGERARSVG